jgi:HEAT repeat protein
MRTPAAFETLTAAVNGDSPDGFLRNAALRALGALGDDKAVPLLREWAMPGKEIPSRQAAIASLARLQKANKEITNQIAGYLTEPHFPVRRSSILALGSRGDASVIPALEALLTSNDLSIEMAPMIKEQIERLKNPGFKGDPGPHGEMEAESAEAGAKGGEDQRLSHLEQLVQEMNERLKAIEGRLQAPTQ